MVLAEPPSTLTPSGCCTIDRPTQLRGSGCMFEWSVHMHVRRPFSIASLLHGQNPCGWQHSLQTSRRKYSAKLDKSHYRASPTCFPTHPLPRLDLNRWDTGRGAVCSLRPFVHTAHLHCPLSSVGALACDASRLTQVVEWWRVSLPFVNDRLSIYLKRNVWLSARPQ